MVYLRQSTMKQVHEHRESTARQYALQQRAVELGWNLNVSKSLTTIPAKAAQGRSGERAFSMSPRR